MDQIGLPCIGMDQKSFCSRIAWKTFCCNAWKTFWLQCLESCLLQCFVGDVAGSNAWKTIAPLRNPDVHMRLCTITSITPVGRWTRALDRHVHTSLHTPVLFVCFVLFCFILLALICVFVLGNAYVFANPCAWTANFEMRLERIDSAGDSASNSERISASTSEPISAENDDSNCMSANNFVDISMICRRSTNVQFSLRTPYQDLNFLATEHQMPIWV